MDICLIPEIDFDLDRLTEHAECLLARKGHIVVCVAEGAGQSLLSQAQSNGAHSTDASGNPILQDVGAFLKDHFKSHIPVSVPIWAWPCPPQFLSFLRASKFLTIQSLAWPQEREVWFHV